MNQKDIFIDEMPNHDYKSIDYFSYKMKLTKKKLRQFLGWFNNLNVAWTPFWLSALLFLKKIQIPTPLLSFLSTNSSLPFFELSHSQPSPFFYFPSSLKRKPKTFPLRRNKLPTLSFAPFFYPSRANPFLFLVFGFYSQVREVLRTLQLLDNISAIMAAWCSRTWAGHAWGCPWRDGTWAAK